MYKIVKVIFITDLKILTLNGTIYPQAYFDKSFKFPQKIKSIEINSEYLKMSIQTLVENLN